MVQKVQRQSLPDARTGSNAFAGQALSRLGAGPVSLPITPVLARTEAFFLVPRRPRPLKTIDAMSKNPVFPGKLPQGSLKCSRIGLEAEQFGIKIPNSSVGRAGDC